MALKVVLDTRFYFSYYSPEDEKTAIWTKKIVQKASRAEIKLTSSVITISELYSTMGRTLGKDAVKIRIASMRAFHIDFIPVTTEIAQLAGEIALGTPRVPLADAIISATALTHAEGNVITDDDHFRLLSDLKLKWLTET